MTMNEKRLNATKAEIEKKSAQLARAQKKLEKKAAAARNLGVLVNWDTWCAMRETATAEQCKAHLEYGIAVDEVKRIEDAISKQQTILEKYSGLVTNDNVKTEAAENWIRHCDMVEKAKVNIVDIWAKDGITLNRFTFGHFSGTTPNGKSFCMDLNNGMTERSWHCWTLYINGETIFTSGDFCKTYTTIKNS